MFSSTFRQTFYVASWQSTDARGDETHGEPVAYACRYEPSTRLLRAANGTQVVSEAILHTAQDVQASDLVWPPGADQTEIGQSRKPIRIERHHDLDTGALVLVAVHI